VEHLVGEPSYLRLGRQVRDPRLPRPSPQASQQLGHDGNHAWTAFGPTNVAVHDLSGAMELGDLLADDKGGPLHRGNFNKRVRWVENVAAIGAPGLHFHDLRHTG
jgi:integrase